MLSKNEIKIIDLLKKNSRKTIKDISKETGIKPSTVHQTITRLKDSKTIEKFTVKLDDKKIQRNFVVFLLINTSKDLDETFFKKDCVDEVFGVTGEYDLLLKLKFKDVEEFNTFLIEFRKDKSIVKTLTMVGTVKIKE